MLVLNVLITVPGATDDDADRCALQQSLRAVARLCGRAVRSLGFVDSERLSAATLDLLASGSGELAFPNGGGVLLARVGYLGNLTFCVEAEVYPRFPQTVRPDNLRHSLEPVPVVLSARVQERGPEESLWVDARRSGGPLAPVSDWSRKRPDRLGIGERVVKQAKRQQGRKRNVQ
jgi:hypothetical protein